MNKVWSSYAGLIITDWSPGDSLPNSNKVLNQALMSALRTRESILFNGNCIFINNLELKNER